MLHQSQTETPASGISHEHNSGWLIIFLQQPVIGSGGVTDWRDAVEFLLAGASAVEIGVAVITHGIRVYGDVATGLRGYLEENGFSSVKEVIGLAHEY